MKPVDKLLRRVLQQKGLHPNAVLHNSDNPTECDCHSLLSGHSLAHSAKHIDRGCGWPVADCGSTHPVDNSDGNHILVLEVPH